MKSILLLLLILVTATIAKADQRCVLAEYTTNASCANCPAATKDVYDALTSTTRTNVALIAYHSPFPTSPPKADPFYDGNKNEINARDGMYDVHSNPSMHVDGIALTSDSKSWLGGLQYELGNASPMSITLDGSIQNQSGVVNVHLSQPAPAGYKLFAVITETELDFVGSNQETTHNDVFRTTIGNGWAGIDLGSALSKQINFTLGIDSLMASVPHPWDPELCRIIVWLQNPALVADPTAQSIAQAAQVVVSSLGGSAVHNVGHPSTATLQLSPNPARDMVELQLSSHANDVNVSIVDLLGRTVYSAAGNAIAHRVSLAGFPAGVYRAVLERSGRVISSSSLIRN